MLGILSLKIRFEAYRLPIINHLLNNCINHWDINIRQLSSQSLGLLAEQFPLIEFETVLLPALITRAEISDCHLHGTLIGVGDIYLGLYKAGLEFSDQFVQVTF